MSSTELYTFNKDGNAEHIADVKNSFRGAHSVWKLLERKYLPSYKPYNEKYGSRLSCFDGEAAMKDVWALFGDKRLIDYERIVFGTTLDNVVVMRKDVLKVIKALRKFYKDHIKEDILNLDLQADVFEKALKDDKKFIAIGWNQTSVCQGWKVEGPVINEGTDEEESSPYNLFKQDKHWDLFEELKKIKGHLSRKIKVDAKEEK